MSDFVKVGDTETFHTSRYELAQAAVHRLQSELHQMTNIEQDFVMSVLSPGHVSTEQLRTLHDLCDKFNV